MIKADLLDINFRTASEWVWLPLAQPMHHAWRWWLLVRRSVSDPTDLTAYVVFAPHASSLEVVVRVAGAGGPWRAALKRPKVRLGWISTKCAVGRGGIGISPWLCGRMPC
jgi:hypothetical protein